MTLQELIEVLQERQMQADHSNPDCCSCDCTGCDFTKLENQWPDGSADYVPYCHWLNIADTGCKRYASCTTVHSDEFNVDTQTLSDF